MNGYPVFSASSEWRTRIPGEAPHRPTPNRKQISSNTDRPRPSRTKNILPGLGSATLPSGRAGGTYNRSACIGVLGRPRPLRLQPSCAISDIGRSVSECVILSVSSTSRLGLPFASSDLRSKAAHLHQVAHAKGPLHLYRPQGAWTRSGRPQAPALPHSVQACSPPPRAPLNETKREKDHGSH